MAFFMFLLDQGRFFREARVFFGIHSSIILMKFVCHRNQERLMSSIISASQSKVSILSRALSQSAWGIVPNRTPRGSNCLVSMFHLDLHADDVRWSLVAQAIPENELFLSKMSIFRNRYIRAVMHAWSNFAKLERYFRPTVYSKAGRSILLSPMGKLVARGRAETIKIFYAWRINRVVYAHA